MASPHEHPEASTLISLALVGAIIGLGKMLSSDEPVTLKKAVGHSIVSAGLGASASLLLLPLPDIPIPVLFGAACALASLGASTIAMLIQKYIEKK